MSDISKNKSVTLYRMIYNELKEKIVNHYFREGDKLPFERELCQTYGVDRITVRKALELLVSEGLVEKQPGRGSFVKSTMKTINTNAGTDTPRNILFVMFNNDNDINNNPFSQNMQLFYATEQMSKQNQCSLIYATLDEKSNLDDLIKGNNITGIVFVSYVPAHVLEQCVKAKIPAVCVNNRYTDIISIEPENERGSFEAIRYLQSKGHKKIAIILGKANYYSTSERFRGYNAAMHLAAQNVDPRYVLEGDWSFDGAREAIFSMLDEVPRDELPTAIFCCSDAMAIGAMDALKERNFSIPNDISVMGFDNVQQSKQVYPRLSTVSVDIAQMAELVMEKLLSSNYDDIRKKGYIIQLPTELKLRQSVKEINT